MPYKKPVGIVTSMLSGALVFQDHRCSCKKAHQQISGSNSFGPRSVQASEWPGKLDRMVAEAISRQVLADEAVVVDAFPIKELRKARTAKRQKKDRRDVRDDPPPQADREEDGHDEADPSEPQLGSAEAERRRQWLKVPVNIRREIEKFHVNMGNLTTTGMARMLRRAGAKPEVLKWAELHRCQACGDTMRAKHPRPTRYAGDFAFNVVLSLDTLTIHDIDGDPHHMLNIVCEGTCFQVVAYLFTGQGIPSARLVMQTFLSCWSSWAGMPQRIWCARGKEYRAALRLP